MHICLIKFTHSFNNMLGTVLDAKNIAVNKNFYIYRTYILLLKTDNKDEWELRIGYDSDKSWGKGEGPYEMPRRRRVVDRITWKRLTEKISE